MAQILEPDICVIGAGAGGLSVAAAAAAFGVPVVLVERGRMGGDCLNYGCVPSKSLIAAARHAMAFAQAPAFGVTGAPARVDFAKVRDHIRGVIAAIAPNDSKERFTGLGVRVIEGTARFTDRATVAVGDAFVIKARRFVIATGSSPAIPAIPGLAETPHHTNETIFDLAECPRHLIVIGAGPVGLELAQAFRALGAAVTVIEAATPLAHDDPECVAVVLDRLARDGVAIRAGTAIRRIANADGEVRVVVMDGIGEETIAGSHLLVATGRTPNIADLGLDRAGIRVETRGIVVDNRLRTTNRRVYAIGDAAGGAPFTQPLTHAANYHAGLVIRQALFRLPVRANGDVIPRVTFTQPELAHVGLDEEAARRRRYRFRVLRWPYHENDRAVAERTTEGHIKVITTPSGRILGATIVGRDAGELIATWSLAVGQRLNIHSRNRRYRSAVSDPGGYR
ncbi:MAG TPA: FAD-dependent oxidoreductase [Xanthobacteraceae bacterium]|jgi:pyruvate/2-oxoglutarate dehydrogenase complex dihydrolipoamide dehydrogenase (E3) component